MGKVPTSKSNCGIPDRVTVARWDRSLYSGQGIGVISVALLRVAKKRASVLFTVMCLEKPFGKKREGTSPGDVP